MSTFRHDGKLIHPGIWNCVLICIVILGSCVPSTAAQNGRWTEDQARVWYSKQPWLVGANYISSDSINQLEMWQAASFNPTEIDRELGWGQNIGMNTMRVFLHDLLWEQDPEGYKQRIDQFLSIASRHGIKPIVVIFDSCWDPFPVLGPQHRPTP